MLKKLQKSRRGVSEVLATVIIIILVTAAASVVAIILVNVDVQELPGGTGEATSKNVKVAVDLVDYNDSDEDSLFDTMTLYVSLDVDSPNIFVKDFDLLLPSGFTIDDTVAWIISDTSQFWNSELYGYTVTYGTINATFILDIDDLSINQGEIESGDSLYIVVYYSYLTEIGQRIDIMSSFFQTDLITFL
jgi:hypothetical protein